MHGGPQNLQLIQHLVQGIRWQIQMERLRLQQWKTLNARVEVATESQRQQVAMSHTIWKLMGTAPLGFGLIAV